MIDDNSEDDNNAGIIMMIMIVLSFHQLLLALAFLHCFSSHSSFAFVPWVLLPFFRLLVVHQKSCQGSGLNPEATNRMVELSLKRSISHLPSV